MACNLNYYYLCNNFLQSFSWLQSPSALPSTPGRLPRLHLRLRRRRGECALRICGGDGDMHARGRGARGRKGARNGWRQLGTKTVKQPSSSSSAQPECSVHQHSLCFFFALPCCNQFHVVISPIHHQDNIYPKSKTLPFETVALLDSPQFYTTYSSLINEYIIKKMILLLFFCYNSESNFYGGLTFQQTFLL